MKQPDNLQNIQVKADSYECSITADIAVFGYKDGQLKILLTKRPIGDFKNHWLLPGGVMVKNETIENCASKVLFALTGFTDVPFQQVKTYSQLNRHPLKRVVTTSFYALIKPEKHPLILKESVERIEWFNLDEIPKNMGFDHANLIKDAHLSLKNNLKDRLIVGELLPEEFTLAELQKLYEDILKINLDRRNFRKRIFQMNIIKNTGVKKVGVKGGPFLYSFNNKS